MNEGHVALKSHHQKYVDAVNGGAYALAQTPSEYATWVVEHPTGDANVIALKNLGNQRYLVAERNGTVNANRSRAGDWERWRVIRRSSTTIALRSHHGRYLVAERDGRLNANRRHIRNWETFAFQSIAVAPPPASRPASPPPAATTVSPQDAPAILFAEAMHATCNVMMRLDAGWYVGTGFVTRVDGEAVICTVGHNIMNSHRNDLASRVIVALHPKGSDQTPIQLECNVAECFVAGAADLAILRLQDPSHLANAEVLEIASSRPAIGSRCYVVGNPLGFDTPSLSEGIVRDNNFTRGDLVESIVISAPVYGGNSGSPILAPDGSVLGIISFAASHSSDPTLSCLAWGASWRVIRDVVRHMHVNSEHFIGGHLGQGTAPSPVRAHPNRSSGTSLVGYEVATAAFGIGTDETIVGIESDERTLPLGAYPGYHSLAYIYLNPGAPATLVVSRDGEHRQIVIIPLALPQSDDVPGGGGSLPLSGHVLGPIWASKEISPESAQDG